MEIISELEDSPRGVYCGTIILEPNGNAIFNVPIRTIAITDNKATYGVGGGIVWDSEAASEFSEIHAKSAILEKATKFSLIECLRIENGELFRTEYHLKRLQTSADFSAFLLIGKKRRSYGPKQRKKYDRHIQNALLLHPEGAHDLALTKLTPKTSE